MSHSRADTTRTDELHRHLARLNLPFMRDNLEQFARQAAQGQWSHVDFLTRLIEGEAAHRQDRSLQRRIRQARLPLVKTLEQFDFTWPQEINRPQVQDLFRLAFIRDKANVVFVGGVGLGKTHLAIALAHAACLAGYRVRFAAAVDVLNNLVAAEKAGRFGYELKKYTRPNLLVLDELGYLPIDQRGADILFQIISQRYERGPIVLTTNKVFNQWPSIFNNDSTLAAAILDRLLHHAEVVVINGRSHRMKDRIES
jgi:DNA replication protein DnaC